MHAHLLFGITLFDFKRSRMSPHITSITGGNNSARNKVVFSTNVPARHESDMYCSSVVINFL